MKFKKGQSGNPAGRPKGSKDKATAALRQRLDLLLSEQFDTIVADLAKLEPKDRVNAWLKMLEYAVPKLQRTDVTSGGDKISIPPIEWVPYSDWTDEQIHTELERLREHT